MKKVLKVILVLFVAVNIMAMFHAYKFTHFSTSAKQRTDPDEIGFPEKMEMLFTGVAILQKNIKNISPGRT